MSNFERCACHSKVPYHKCCQRYHDGATPESALVLMRSRYCAYAKNLPGYIISTTHRDNQGFQPDSEKWKSELAQFSRETHFDALKILAFVDGEDAASVTFTASLRQAGHDASFTEKSQFVKEAGRWLYRSGEVSHATDG
jgi:SEC-C motif domain protein